MDRVIAALLEHKLSQLINGYALAVSGLTPVHRKHYNHSVLLYSDRRHGRQGRISARIRRTAQPRIYPAVDNKHLYPAHGEFYVVPSLLRVFKAEIYRLSRLQSPQHILIKITARQHNAAVFYPGVSLSGLGKPFDGALKHVSAPDLAFLYSDYNLLASCAVCHGGGAELIGIQNQRVRTVIGI